MSESRARENLTERLNAERRRAVDDRTMMIASLGAILCCGESFPDYTHAIDCAAELLDGARHRAEKDIPA